MNGPMAATAAVRSDYSLGNSCRTQPPVEAHSPANSDQLSRNCFLHKITSISLTLNASDADSSIGPPSCTERAIASSYSSVIRVVEQMLPKNCLQPFFRGWQILRRWWWRLDHPAGGHDRRNFCLMMNFHRCRHNPGRCRGQWAFQLCENNQIVPSVWLSYPQLTWRGGLHSVWSRHSQKLRPSTPLSPDRKRRNQGTQFPGQHRQEVVGAGLHAPHSKQGADHIPDQSSHGQCGRLIGRCSRHIRLGSRALPERVAHPLQQTSTRFFAFVDNSEKLERTNGHDIPQQRDCSGQRLLIQTRLLQNVLQVSDHRGIVRGEKVHLVTLVQGGQEGLERTQHLVGQRQHEQSADGTLRQRLQLGHFFVEIGRSQV